MVSAGVVVRGDNHPVALQQHWQGGPVLDANRVAVDPRAGIDSLQMLFDNIHLETIFFNVAEIGADDPVEVGDLDPIRVNQVNGLESSVDQVFSNNRPKPANTDDRDGLAKSSPGAGCQAQRERAPCQESGLYIGDFA